MPELAELKEQLNILETVRLPRLLERISELKSKINGYVDYEALHQQRLARITDKHRDLYQESHDLYSYSNNIKESDRTKRYAEIMALLAEELQIDIPERHLKILKFRAEGKAHTEIAKHFNLSSATIRQNEYKSYRRIRWLMEQDKKDT